MKSTFRLQNGTEYITVIFISLLVMANSCRNETEYYSFSDFAKVEKTDVHLHINSLDPRYMELAARYNFRVVSPNVDSRIPLDEQLNTASQIKKAWPERFTFLGTFSVDSFGTTGFADNTIARINECMEAGASGIKIWKNIGMVLKDNDGRFVMVDDPAFDEIAKRLDMFPEMKVDMSARMAHLQYQSIADLERVRNFIIKYQDRILYGTDITINASESNPEARSQALLERWESNWIYLATDSTLKIRNIQGNVRGLKLPGKVINKIYNENADIFFIDTGL